MPLVCALVHRHDQRAAAPHEEIRQIEHAGQPVLNGRCFVKGVDSRKVDERLIWRRGAFGQQQVRGHSLAAVRRIEADRLDPPIPRRVIDDFGTGREVSTIVGYRLA